MEASPKMATSPREEESNKERKKERKKKRKKERKKKLPGEDRMCCCARGHTYRQTRSSQFSAPPSRAE